MAELAKQIIRQQWDKRHDPDPGIRNQAVSLIKTHVVMIRSWEKKVRHHSVLAVSKNQQDMT